MRTWNLSWEDPLYPVLCADVRLGPVDYVNDQVWEVRLEEGDPPALALATTYGLRARLMRLFPLFTEAARTVHAPSQFAEGVRFQQLFPNYLRCVFAPFSGLDVTLEVWVPDSHTVSGRVRVRNSGTTPRRMQMTWAAQLTPVEGEGMHPQTLGGVQVLVGRTGGLTPLLFFTGGLDTVASPLPAFLADFDLLPGAARTLRWVHVGLADAAAALDHARRVAARSWDAEIARIELLNAAQVTVYTGEPALDAALHMAQQAALQHVLHCPADLPHPFAVGVRSPETGFSLAGDGSDYPPAQRGSTPLLVWHQAQTLLPVAPRLVAGWVENFLHSATPDGAVDMFAHPGGQRSQVLAMPVLIPLAEQVHAVLRDHAWLGDVFPRLLAFFHHWFEAHHDVDGDGFPEWEHPLQLETEEHPAFAWEPWAQGLDTAFVEDPALGAMLIRAAQSLMRMAEALGETAPLPALQAISDNLALAIQAAWQPQAGFRCWDRDTHLSPPGEELGLFPAGDVALRRRWERPQRLVVRLMAPEAPPRAVEVFIQGVGRGGQHRVERLRFSAGRWFHGQATATSREVYQAVEHITVQDAGPDVRLSVRTADLGFDSLLHFLPLWCGLPDAQQAEVLHARLTDPEAYDQPFGLPLCPQPATGSAADAGLGVFWPWVGMVLEGLVACGYRATAADLYLRTLRGTVRVLRREHTFRRLVHALDGRGLGERHSAFGLPPVGLFLEVAGLRLISPWEVQVLDRNPFPWPLEVRWRGLHLRHTAEVTEITFPDGERATVVERGAFRVLGRAESARQTMEDGAQATGDGEFDSR